MRWLLCLMMLVSCAPKRLPLELIRSCPEDEVAFSLSTGAASPRRIAVAITTVGRSQGRVAPACPGPMAHFSAALREELERAGLVPIEVPLNVTPRDLAMIGASKLLRGTVVFTTHDPGVYEAGLTPLVVDGTYTLSLVELAEGSVIATSIGTMFGRGSITSFEAAIRDVIDEHRAAVVRPLVTGLSTGQ